MTEDKTDSMNEFIDAVTPTPDAEQRLEWLKALGLARIPERFSSLPSDLTDVQRWDLHEYIETCVRRDRIRQRLRAM